MNDPGKAIAEEIRRDGPMTLARFMELALYMPGGGYYERERGIGRGGDFYTSVSVGSVFGELLAFQFAQWLEKLEAAHPVIVEMGAHDGRLAADILGWLRAFRPELFERAEYWFIESSATRRAWQERTIERFVQAGPKVRWLEGLPLGNGGLGGVIFSNEFFDALPQHRLRWDAGTKEWREWRIVLTEGEKLTWAPGRLSVEAAGHQPVIAAELAAALPDGYNVEVCPAAASIWRACAQSLSEGKVLAIDYGLTAEEWLRPERTNGTLRGYAGHCAVSDILDQPGNQDITAHVNFSALQEAGEKAELRTEGLWRQEQFLTRILANTQADPKCFAAWTPERTRQFQTLTHPQHLGLSFRVLAQSVEAKEV